jgi:pyranose oxidase
MPVRLTQDNIDNLLGMTAEGVSLSGAERIGELQPELIVTDVFIAGSGPIACTYARLILEAKDLPQTKVYMAEIGSQDSPVIGAHHKNSIKYQKDIDAFVNVIKGALQPVSIPPGDTHQSTLARASWRPSTDPSKGQLVIQGHNPNQMPDNNLRGSAITRTVGGMATHWTCSCPVPHDEERANNPIDSGEFNTLLDRAKNLLNVNDDQYESSIRHTVVKDALRALAQTRGMRSIPLAVKRRSDNPDYVAWTGCDTILGKLAGDPRFTLATERRVTKLFSSYNSNRVTCALVRDLNTNKDVVVIAKTFIIACGAVCTPQILWNSNIRPPALGRYLSEQSMAFCQIVLKTEIIESIRNDERFAKEVAEHQGAHPNDPLPIPFNDPEPQVMIPYTHKFPWHVQIHRDAFSYGDIGPKADPRVVVDLRFFGKSDIVADNRVDFGLPIAPTSWAAGITDIYGMPQATFNVVRTDGDGDRDQKMMKDMTDIANVLGGYLPGSYPQFMEPGLAMHITGTTRIGSDPRTSVANASSKVHGFDNLWVGGNGVIPDATASNPTRTSVAYAIKGSESVVNYLRSCPAQ